jgi:tetratricopeptide (TPR) repeat protein
MPHFCPKALCIFALACCLTACSSRMDTNPERLGKVETDGRSMVKGGPSGAQPSSPSESSPSGGATAGMHEGDMATMEVVANGCLKAWRKACSGDEKESLKMLSDLDKHYPGVLTIQMMTGQVYEHFGQSKEAIEHYSKAVTGNEFSSFHAFKLAEAMSKNGDNKGAAAWYRKVLANAPEFGAAKLGLAKCLLVADKQSTEARTLLSEAKSDELSAKEAQALLDQLEPGAKAGN